MKHILEPNELEAIRDLVRILTQNYWSNDGDRISFKETDLNEAVELANKISQWLR